MSHPRALILVGLGLVVLVGILIFGGARLDKKAGGEKGAIDNSNITVLMPTNGKVVTSNGFMFDVPDSWSLNTTTSNGWKGAEQINLYKSDGRQLVTVVCPVSLQYEGPYGVEILSNQSRTFTDTGSKSFQISYAEMMSDTLVDGHPRKPQVEYIDMEVKPIPNQSEMGEIVPKACLVRAAASGNPIDVADVAAVKNIFSSWTTINKIQDANLQVNKTISMRLDTGAYTTLTIEPCVENDLLQCFGSGATDPQTRGTLTVFDLVSKECEPSYGVIVRNDATSTYYTVSAKVQGTACNDQSNYGVLKMTILGTPSFYVQ